MTEWTVDALKDLILLSSALSVRRRLTNLVQLDVDRQRPLRLEDADQAILIALKLQSPSGPTVVPAFPKVPRSHTHQLELESCSNCDSHQIAIIMTTKQLSNALILERKAGGLPNKG